MRIAICDTDVKALLKFVRMLDHCLYERNREAKIEVFVSGDGLLSRRERGRRYDAYVIAAGNSDADGVALGRKIRETQPGVPIVYVAEGVAAPTPESSFDRVLESDDYDAFAAAIDGFWRADPE